MTPSPSARSGRDSSSARSSGRTLASAFGTRSCNKQVGRFQQRPRDEAPLHRAVAQQIDQGEQAHPLVMRHERTDGDARFIRRQTRGRVVDRFVETVSAFASFVREPLQIFTRFPRGDHQRHRGRIRRDHQVLGQAAFQTQSGNTKSAVLIVLMHIGPVVSRFGDAPRNTSRISIFDLLPHGRSCRPDRAGCCRSSASPAAASDTRTSSRSRKPGSARRAARRAGGRARTSDPAAPAPARW